MKTNSFYKDKVVLVTGSSMGIGKEIARQVLVNGGKVVITGRNKDRLDAVKKEFCIWKNNMIFHQGDVSNYENNIELINVIIEKYGRLDILINNAGLSSFGEVEKMNSVLVKQIIDTNIYGSLFPVMAAIPQLKKSKGSIIFISSIAGFHGIPSYAAYSLSKMSLIALAQSLSIELNNSGISVSISYVGFTENENDKRTLSPNGEWVEVPQRPKSLTASRERTASKILKQVKNKKFSKTHSLVGIGTKLLTKYFPSLCAVIFKLSYSKLNRQNKRAV